MTTARVMLYVTNVQETANFWEKYLSFDIEETIDLGTSQTIVLNLGDHFRIQLFEVAFIKENSPEVSLEVPSIAIFTEDIESFHQKIKTAGTFISEIETFGGQVSFNFQDNEGRYFAVIKR